MNVTLRAGRPADAEACGRICYEAFKAIADQHNFRAQRLDRIDLDFGSRPRHHNDGLEAQFLRSKSYALRVIACAGSNYPALTFRIGQLGDLVIGPAQLEAEHGLLVFPLEPDTVGKTIR